MNTTSKNALIDKYAEPGEHHVTNATIRDDEKVNTAEAFERQMKIKHPDLTLRFDYEHVVYGEEVLDSIEFGFRSTNLRRGHARGVAVYGKPKTA